MSEKQETCGNSAAMREAIGYLCERMADMDATFDPSEVECLRAALSAPPRNCDLFETDEEAFAHWCQIRNIKAERGGYGMAWAFTKWLFKEADFITKTGGAK